MTSRPFRETATPPPTEKSSSQSTRLVHKIVSRREIRSDSSCSKPDLKPTRRHAFTLKMIETGTVRKMEQNCPKNGTELSENELPRSR